VDPWGLVYPRAAFTTVLLIAALGFVNYVLLRPRDPGNSRSPDFRRPGQQHGHRHRDGRANPARRSLPGRSRLTGHRPGHDGDAPPLRCSTSVSRSGRAPGALRHSSCLLSPPPDSLPGKARRGGPWSRAPPSLALLAPLRAVLRPPLRRPGSARGNRPAHARAVGALRRQPGRRSRLERLRRRLGRLARRARARLLDAGGECWWQAWRASR
jgi:hypothetical protein